MTREELVECWSDAAQSGTLLTPKHDPNNLAIAWASYRTVLSHSMSGSLQHFIQSGSYDITEYTVSGRPPRSAEYYVVTPRPESGFNVVGSGVPSGSVTPSGSMDRLCQPY